MGVIGFIRVRWVLSGAPSGWSGSFGFVGFILAHPVDRQVISDSLGTFGNALAVVWFIRFRWLHSGA